MAPPLKTGGRNFSYSFVNPNLNSVECLAKKITPDESTNFRERYGYILSLLKMPFTKYEQEGIHTLLQFYHPSLRCFTFTDYLLAPILEEYSSFLGIPVGREVPYYSAMKAPDSIEISKALYLSKPVVEANLTKKGGCHGFRMEFLVKRGCDAAEAKEWDTFRAILALSIYGIVMFANVPDFVDMNAIHIFILQNPVPTLLGDVYHSVHHRNGQKGGLVRFCAPLLYRWFRSHLPERGAFVDSRYTSRWAERIMGLRAKDIVWYNRSLDDMEVVMSCGKFKNAPLMGIRGGINYNPVLARRTYGYAFIGPPERAEIAENIFYHSATNAGQMGEAAQAWKSICWRDKKHFGQRDCANYKNYTEWVEAVANTQGMPFPPKDPLYPPTGVQPNTVSMPRYNQTVEQNRKLTEQMETMQEIELEELYARGSTSQKRPKVAIDSKSARSQERELKEHYEAQLADLTKKLQIQTENANSEKSRRKKADKLLVDRQNTIEKCYEEIRKLKGQIREKDQSNAQVLEEARYWEVKNRHMETMHFRKDLLIQEIIKRPTRAETKKLFEEMKTWSDKNIGESPLRHVDMGDPA
ncbi:uncharacterized protein LOC131625951 [Vicia villosa]|uniref:uncharacterized protein LOC131625951 n=1 Tax=Vicia villosa TaxID=3911 RepID=UPI00273AB57B|nr:uncharacterized protein LOC131625951 [Vicia villosa]